MILISTQEVPIRNKVIVKYTKITKSLSLELIEIKGFKKE